jgi:hypothetical protein
MTPQRTTSPDWLTGAGEMRERVRTYDWSKTPLGAIEEWPQSLRIAVSLCLASNFPINIVWGPEHTQIYNDGYSVREFSEHSSWRRIGQRFEAGRVEPIENPFSSKALRTISRARV